MEAEQSAVETKSHDEMTSLAERHSGEMERLRDEKEQLALTICELEESLDKATNKVKEYKSEISSLQRTLAGQLIIIINFNENNNGIASSATAAAQLSLQLPGRKSNTLVSQPHSHFCRLLSRHWDQSMSQLLTSSTSWDVGSPPSSRRSDRPHFCSSGCQSQYNDTMQLHDSFPPGSDLWPPME